MIFGLNKSKKVKRLITSLLAVVTGLAATYPALTELLPYLLYVAGFFGVTGVVHAAVAGTVTKFSSGSLASVFTTLWAIAIEIPELQVFLPLIKLLAVIFGAGAVGAYTAKK